MLLALVSANTGNIHKFGGYSTLVWKILKDYENDKNPGDNLIKAHRILGYTTLFTIASFLTAAILATGGTKETTPTGAYMEQQVELSKRWFGIKRGCKLLKSCECNISKI